MASGGVPEKSIKVMREKCVTQSHFFFLRERKRKKNVLIIMTSSVRGMRLVCERVIFFGFWCHRFGFSFFFLLILLWCGAFHRQGSNIQPIMTCSLCKSMGISHIFVLIRLRWVGMQKNNKKRRTKAEIITNLDKILWFK